MGEISPQNVLGTKPLPTLSSNQPATNIPTPLPISVSNTKREDKLNRAYNGFQDRLDNVQTNLVVIIRKHLLLTIIIITVYHRRDTSAWRQEIQQTPSDPPTTSPPARSSYPNRSQTSTKRLHNEDWPPEAL
jgi:hypothetical protein